MLSYKNVPILRILIFLIVFAPQTSQAQWIKTSPTGADGSGPFDTLGNRFYAGGGDGPMTWTSDAGNRWHDASNDFPGGEGIQSIASIGNVLIAGSGPYNNPFYFSTDSGASWNPCNWHGGFGPAIYAMTEHDGYVFAGSNNWGIYRSSDSGQDWELDNNGLPSMWTLGTYSFAAYDSILFAGSTIEYIYRTTNDGATWDTVRLNPDIYVDDVIQSLTVIGHVVLAATSGGLYRSTDLGLTWNQLDTALFYYRHDPRSLTTVNGYVVVGMKNTILRSRDSGLTWQSFAQGWPSGTDATYLTAFDGYFFAGSNDGPGIWRRPISDLAGGDYVSPPTKVTQSSGPLEIYDVLGRLIYHGAAKEKPTLPGGLYFERQGTIVQKIWVP